MIKEWINLLRVRLHLWLVAEPIRLSTVAMRKEWLDDLSVVIDEQNKLKDRVQALEEAYAADPRRAEIAKEKAEQPNHIAGFTPRTKRIAAWQDQRRAEPKK